MANDSNINLTRLVRDLIYQWYNKSVGMIAKAQFFNKRNMDAVITSLCLFYLKLTYIILTI